MENAGLLSQTGSCGLSVLGKCNVSYIFSPWAEQNEISSFNLLSFRDLSILAYITDWDFYLHSDSSKKNVSSLMEWIHHSYLMIAPQEIS